MTKLNFATPAPFTWRYLAIEGGWKGELVLGSRSTMLSLGMPALQYLGRLQYNAKPVEGDLPLSLASYVPAVHDIPIFPGPIFITFKPLM